MLLLRTLKIDHGFSGKNTNAIYKKKEKQIDNLLIEYRDTSSIDVQI